MVLASQTRLRAGRPALLLGSAAWADDINTFENTNSRQRRRGREQVRTGISGRLCDIRLRLLMDLPYRMATASQTEFPAASPPTADG
jgi:hypothetical protein